jgi:peptide/nickel transport system ATP-binding protein
MTDGSPATGTGTPGAPGEDRILLEVSNLVTDVGFGRDRVRALSNVSITIGSDEVLGVVGESGSGKTTLARSIAQFVRPSSGSVRFEGRELTRLRSSDLREVRRRMQMIFQDPISSLNARRTIEDIVAEPLAIWKIGSRAERRRRAHDMLASVGIDPRVMARRHPRELSGGQCQRVSIARALMLSPRLLILDEPVAALDVSLQAQILNLLEESRERFGLAMMLVAHDLAVVRNASDRVAVMYMGKLCEVAASDDLYSSPRHPYTAALLASVPRIEAVDASVARVAPPKGEPPSLRNPPSGCRYRTRCPFATERCTQQEPALREVGAGHVVACHFPLA